MAGRTPAPPELPALTFAHDVVPGLQRVRGMLATTTDARPIRGGLSWRVGWHLGRAVQAVLDWFARGPFLVLKAPDESSPNLLRDSDKACAVDPRSGDRALVRSRGG